MRRQIIAACTLITLFFAAPTASSASFTPAQIQGEFQELYTRLQSSHYDLYARRPKAEYDALFQKMLAGFDRPMTEIELRIQFQKFTAFGRIAHANIAFPADVFGAYRDAGGKTFPVLLRVLAGRAYVSENYSGLASVATGDEVVALNGQPIAHWLTRLASNISADNDYMAVTMLENRLPALLWLELGRVDQFALSLRTSAGTKSVTVLALTRSETRAAAQAQKTMLELDWDKREFKMLPAGMGYLRPGPFYNNEPGATNPWDTAPFRRFIDDAFGSLIRANARTIMIDLRDNPGGDNSFSDLMVSWYATKPFRFASDFRIKVSQAAIDSNRKRLELAPNDTQSISHKLAAAYAQHRIGDVFSFEIPIAHPRPGHRFGGKVHLLVNRHTYSNSVQVAALSQDHGFAKIIGEETADLATTYGAMEQFILSRTKIEVGFPKALIIRVNGNVAARGVVPDIAIETPIVQMKDDPVLTRAIAIALQAR